MKSHIEHAGAVLQMEPKADYVARKKKQRHERPLSPHNPANANGISSGAVWAKCSAAWAPQKFVPSCRTQDCILACDGDACLSLSSASCCLWGTNWVHLITVCNMPSMQMPPRLLMQRRQETQRQQLTQRWQMQQRVRQGQKRQSQQLMQLPQPQTSQTLQQHQQQQSQQLQQQPNQSRQLRRQGLRRRKQKTSMCRERHS